MKQLSKSHSQIFERIVRALDGRLFRVRFVVFERDGVLRGRVVSCEAALSFSCVKDKGLRIKDFHLCLPAWRRPQIVKSEKLKVKSSLVSPYFNKFDFMTVIKIRAPSRFASADRRGLDAD